ncbi:WD40 repeat domain-containing protein [Lentzea guizhouensis]|nr:WD40 repeat domain-containing protein [Lentzea guizhouensis]
MSEDDQRVVVAGAQGAELLDVSDPARPFKVADLPVSSFTATTNARLDVLADLVPDARRGRAPKVWLLDGGGWREVAVPGDREAIGVRLSPDGRTLAVKRLDGFWELWRLEGDQARLMSETVMGVWQTAYEFSGDGRFLIQAGSDLATAEVWDVSDPATPVLWADFPLPSANDTTLVEFSADSRHVLVASDRGAHVWDLRRQHRPERIAAFEAFPEDITAVDHWPATGEFAVVVRGETVWPLRTDPDQVVKDQCRGYASLSASEWATYFPDMGQVEVC